MKNNFTFPSENSKVENVNNFIRCLLNKKVNERICNVSALKKKPFFEGFEFDKLNDFRLKAPYRPNKQNFDKYLKENNPYENYVKEDTKNAHKRKENEDDYIPPDYNPNWADEF